jgi:hypothetical protein
LKRRRREEARLARKANGETQAGAAGLAGKVKGLAKGAAETVGGLVKSAARKITRSGE